MIQRISNDEYHQDKKYLTGSSLAHYAKCPKLYKAWLDGELPSMDSNAFTLGSLVHTITMEPQKLESEWVILEKMDKRTLVYKEASSEAALSGKKVTDSATYSQACFMRDSLLEDEFIRNVVEECQKLDQVELSIYQDIYLKWTYPQEDIKSAKCPLCGETYYTGFWYSENEYHVCESCGGSFIPSGVKLKVRPDLIVPSIIADIKTTQSADVKMFKKSVRDYSYNLQAPMQKLVTEMEFQDDFPEYYWFVVEKNPPYLASPIRIADETLARWSEQLGQMLLNFKRDQNFDSWPGYGFQSFYEY